MPYFDNNATTELAPQVIEAMARHLSEGYGNPSSAHLLGRQSRKQIERAREAAAQLVGASAAEEMVFTSGGTESDNWAILGALRAKPDKDHIITTRVEHEAVRILCEDLERSGYRVTWLDVDEDGLLNADQLRDSLEARTAVVSIMMANNETGILFPVNELANIVKDNSDALFHVDGVNAVGKIPVDLKGSAIDLFSLSAHKFHGPKGIGALFVRDGVGIAPLISGGGQQAGRRPGTEAVHQIAGLAAAAEFVGDLSEMEKVRGMRDRLETEILQKIPNSRLNGTADANRRLPNTSNISFGGVNGELILSRLDDLGVYVSTGSACNSSTHKVSAVLQAMNVPYTFAAGSIRFSLGRLNTDEEVSFLLEHLPGIISELTQLTELTSQ